MWWAPPSLLKFSALSPVPISIEEYHSDPEPVPKKIDRGKVIFSADKTGDSYANEIFFQIDGLDKIRLYCSNWSDKLDYWDALNVVISGKEFGKFLSTDPY